MGESKEEAHSVVFVLPLFHLAGLFAHYFHVKRRLGEMWVLVRSDLLNKKSGEKKRWRETRRALRGIEWVPMTADGA